MLQNLKDLWTTLPGIVAVIVAVGTYIQTYAATNGWPPSIMELLLFFSGLLNVFSTLKARSQG